MSNYSTALNGRARKDVSQSVQSLGDSAINMGYVMHDSSDTGSLFSDLNYESLVLEQDTKGHSALWAMLQRADREFTLKEVRQEAGLSDTEARNRVNWYVSRKAVVYREVPARNPNLRPTYLYRFANGIEVEKLKDLLANQIPLQEKPVISEQKQSGPAQSRRTEVNSPISNRLSATRPSFQGKYIQLIILADNKDGITVKAAARATGQPKATVHSQLEKLRLQMEILKRKKGEVNPGEFVYFLAPGTTREEIEQLHQVANSQGLSELTSVPKEFDRSKEQEVSNLVEPEANLSQPLPQAQPKALPSSGKLKSSKKAELLLEKFPAFDPSWSTEIQEKWFASFERLERMMNSSEEDR